MALLESVGLSGFFRHRVSDDDKRLLDRDSRIVSRELSSSNVTGSPQLLISVTCVIGGSIILLLLVYAIRRRAAATARANQTQPSHGVRRAKSKTIPREDLTALPKYRQECSMDTLAQVTTLNSRPDVNESPTVQQWREKTIEKQTASIQTKAVEDAETDGKARAPPKLTEPEPALAPQLHARDPAPRHARQSPKEKIMAVVAKRGIAASRIQHDLESQLSPGRDAGLDDNRWSWTNSQAPTTPRVRAFSMRFSNSSLVSLPPLPMPVAQNPAVLRASPQKAQDVDVSSRADSVSASQAVQGRSDTDSVIGQKAELPK